MPSRHGTYGPTGRPFTLVVCTACGSSAQGRALERLRLAVRGCPHGVMVTSGCLSLFLACRSGPGLFAVVQPCTADREPDGPLVRLGPILNGPDTEAVCQWLRNGMPDDGALPPRLLAQRSPRRTAHLN